MLRRLLVLSLLAVAVGLLPARPAQAQPTANAAVAQARFDRGRTLFQQGDHAAALTEFRASQDLVHSPNTRLYVGLCLQRLNRLAEAYTELGRAAAEATDLATTDRRYVSARDIARREATALETRIGRITLHLDSPPQGLVLHLGDNELATAALGIPVPLDPGDIVVRAEAPGYLPFQRTVHLAAGASEDVSITIEPAPTPVPATVPETTTPTTTTPETTPAPTVTPVTPPPPTGTSPVRIAGFVAGGVGVAAMVTFTILGFMARAQYDGLVTDCGNTHCPPSRTADIDAGVGLQTGANVSLGVGLVALAAGVVMIAAGGSASHPEPTHPAPVARWQPTFDPARGLLGVRGAF